MKVQKTRTCRYHILTFLRGVHFWILQNQKFKLPVDRSGEAPSISPSQKSIILRRTHTRTDIRLSGTHGRKERFAQIFKKINHRANERTNEGRTTGFLVPTDGKSASRNNLLFLLRNTLFDYSIFQRASEFSPRPRGDAKMFINFGWPNSNLVHICAAGRSLQRITLSKIEARQVYGSEDLQNFGCSLQSWSWSRSSREKRIRTP